MQVCNFFAVVLAIVAAGMITTSSSCAQAQVLPPATSATANMSNLILVYVDSRSATATSVEQFSLMIWSKLTNSKMFDGIQLMGYEWKGGSCFWPGQCKVPLNVEDGLEIFDLWMKSVSQLNEAAGDLKLVGKMKRDEKIKIVISNLYPDTRQENFGRISQDGKSLNFSLKNPDGEKNRILAVESWILNWTKVFSSGSSRRFEHVQLVGFYHFLEIMKDYDVTLTRTIGHYLSTRISPPLIFNWIPYYDACLSPSLGVDHWKYYGFNSAQIQPNFAFQNVGIIRFEQVNALAEKYHTGVELELPLYSRNSLLHKNFTESFYDYLHACQVTYGWCKKSFLSFYFGTQYNELATSTNATLKGMFKSLTLMIKNRWEKV